MPLALPIALFEQRQSSCDLTLTLCVLQEQLFSSPVLRASIHSDISPTVLFVRG